MADMLMGLFFSIWHGLAMYGLLTLLAPLLFKDKRGISPGER